MSRDVQYILFVVPTNMVSDQDDVSEKDYEKYTRLYTQSCHKVSMLTTEVFGFSRRFVTRRKKYTTKKSVTLYVITGDETSTKGSYRVT